MVAITTSHEKLPEDCDVCKWYACYPHPYKGWTDICELAHQPMDDDQPQEWHYGGSGRPDACPLVETDRQTGEWQVEMCGSNYSEWEDVTCAVCGVKFKHFYPSRYCPECGSYNGGKNNGRSR